MAEKIQQQAAPKLRVRFAKAEDAALVVKLVRELTEYQQEPLENVKLTEADIIRDSFGAPPCIETILAEVDGKTAGSRVLSQLFHLGRAAGHLPAGCLCPGMGARLGVGRRLMAEMARHRPGAGLDQARPLRAVLESGARLL